MENPLDLAEFERLSGPDFTRYVVKTKDILVDDNFLKYFVEKKGGMDDVHLELGLYWLGKSGSLAACHEIANYIDHPNQSFRFLAVGFIVEMKHEVDARIMSRVIKALDQNLFPQSREALTSILKKAATSEAQALALQYLAGQASEGRGT